MSVPSWHDQGIHLIWSLFSTSCSLSGKSFFLSSEAMNNLFVSLISCQTYLNNSRSSRNVSICRKKGRAGRIIVPVREHRPSGAVKWGGSWYFPTSFDRMAIRAHSRAYGRTGARHLRSPGTGTRPGIYTWVGTATGGVAALYLRRLRRKTFMSS